MPVTTHSIDILRNGGIAVRVCQLAKACVGCRHPRVVLHPDRDDSRMDALPALARLPSADKRPKGSQEACEALKPNGQVAPQQWIAYRIPQSTVRSSGTPDPVSLCSCGIRSSVSCSSSSRIGERTVCSGTRMWLSHAGQGPCWGRMATPDAWPVPCWQSFFRLQARTRQRRVSFNGLLNHGLQRPNA